MVWPLNFDVVIWFEIQYAQNVRSAQVRCSEKKREEENWGLRDLLNKYLKEGGDGEAGASKVNVAQQGKKQHS